MHVSRLKFSWNLFLRFELTASVQIMAWRLPGHYLNQWWLVYWRKYTSLGINELLINDLNLYLNFQGASELSESGSRPPRGHKRAQWKRNIVILTKFASLAAFGQLNDERVFRMTFPFSVQTGDIIWDLEKTVAILRATFFKFISLNANCEILTKISLKFIPEVPI